MPEKILFKRNIKREIAIYLLIQPIKIILFIISK
jgi:hypothetical protein